MGGITQSQDFRMRSWITIDFAPITRNCEHLSVGIDHNRTDRDIATLSGGTRLDQSLLHPRIEIFAATSHHLLARDHCAEIPKRSAI